MATNLRLKPAAEAALRKESERTGRSQQELIRESVDRFLGLVETPAVPPGSLEDLYARGILIPPKEPMRHANNPIKLPPGVSSLELLDREDRF
ncbi:MAG: hypothetical protein JWP85_1378 [Rhodoglobus sp.]|nr:hypothetical protein [Rhodoglobus sp.]